MAALLLIAAPTAGAGSLPEVKSGERPGPPLLYKKPPKASPLSVKAPFAARPLLVSGTDAYRDGEYLYQDYLFDDHGADTQPGLGSQPPGADSFSPTGGDAFYPTAARFGNNAADIVELRIKPTSRAVLYRVTLNTVRDEDAAVVGIGIDTDRSGGAPVPWPGGAGISSPGLDRFITAWGTGGKVTRLPGGADADLPARAVKIEKRTNQMTIRVPRSVMDPGRRTWRYVAGAGLRSGEGFRRVPARSDPGSDTPASGNPVLSSPGVFNLAFRFDEPTAKNGAPTYTTFPGVGSFFEDKQAKLLRERSTGNFHADVDFARLRREADRRIHGPRPGEQARIFASRLEEPEGIRASGRDSADFDEFPEFGGQLQPYVIRVPPSYRRSRPAGLSFSLHSLGGTYTQYTVFNQTQQRQFGDQRDNFLVTTLGRGPDGWYTREAEVDFFEAWADAARHFSLDPRSVALTGYSMGGYGTYKLGAQWPDLFGKAFTTVGPPGLGIWVPPAPPQSGGQDTLTNLLLENVRWIPYLNWVAMEDDLVPYAGPLEQQTGAIRGRGFDTLGLRSVLETFQGEHFTLAIQDQFAAARDFLGKARVKRDPSRVDYAMLPGADFPKLGLVHDHAYWVSDLRGRDRSGNPETQPESCPPRGGCPPRSEISAFSEAFGEAYTPRVRRVAPSPRAAGRPSPSTAQGTRWNGIPQIARRNRLVLRLENLARGTIDGRRARLEGDEPLRVRLESDGRGRIRLNVPLPRGAVVRRIDGGPVSSAATAPEVSLDRRGATFDVADGNREYRILVPHGSRSGRSGGGDAKSFRRGPGPF